MINLFQTEDGKFFTKVEFKGGDIGVSPLINTESKIINHVIFDNLDKTYEIGHSFTEKDGTPYHIKENSVIFHFHSAKSIDVIIKALNEVKQSLLKEERDNNNQV